LTDSLLLTRFRSNTGISVHQLEQTIKLFEEGATVPFIARYRKEKTGGLSDENLLELKKLLKEVEDFNNRKQFIINTLKAKGVFDLLKDKIAAATTLNELEDIYLPFKEKRKNRAQNARDAGLEPLAQTLIRDDRNAKQLAEKYISSTFADTEKVLQGARDIIAELISENHQVRKTFRQCFEQKSFIISKVIKSKLEEAVKYKDYFDYKEKITSCAAHRLLAILRGDKEKLLRVSVMPDSTFLLNLLFDTIKSEGFYLNAQVKTAAEDACNRLLIPSMENETIGYYRLKAETESARLFAVVLKQLLLAPPLGQKNILAIDPGFKSGCKIVCLDKNGRLLHNETIYPHPPQSQQKIASNKISTLVSQYKIDAIAIGDGTAGRETGTFIQRLRFDRKIQVFMVNEDGASVYSATAEARKEFPEYDVTVRGAVSIGRRLMDPLAELIKINPRSLGIGQYQHEIDEMMLNSALDQTIEHCVNTVGVNLETASEKLLTYVSGIGEVMAKKIIDARTHSGIHSRSELKKIKGMGDKTFEMCAGFIRINGDNPLDKSAVHPENYTLVERMAEDIDTTITGLIGNESLIQKIDITKYVTDEVGLPTLKDIIAELSKPGRDVRGIIKVFEFNSEIKSINDLQPDMLLPGIITNITNFGAFVDIGIKKDGLVHISEISDAFISDISTAVRLNQQVMVKVLSADITTGRIQFSMKGIQQP